MSKVTLKDVAQEANVSAMTVSKALNNKPGISKQTRKTILEIAERMNYSPNLIAKSLRVNETKTVGVILSNTSEIVTSTVLRGIQDVAEMEGYSILLSNTDRKIELEREAIRTLMSKQIDGLILIASMLHSDEDISELQRLQIPFISLLRKKDRMSIDTVTGDNFLGGYKSVQHLLEQGCRSFQVIALSDIYGLSDRQAGYEQAFRDFRVPQDCVNIVYGGPFIDSGYKTMNRIISESESNFDAVICSCDMIAIGAMEALLEHGVRIPQDVRIIGYDGIYMAKYLRVPLTTIEQPLYQIGEEGMRILLERIRFPSISVRKIVLKNELVVRASTVGEKTPAKNP